MLLHIIQQQQQKSKEENAAVAIRFLKISLIFNF